MPLLGGLSSLLSRKIKTVQMQIVRETTALAGATTESLRNIELVKSLGLAQQEIDRLNSTTAKILKLELKKVRYLRSLSFIQGTCVNLLRTSILFLMLYLIFTQRITRGPVLLAFHLFLLHLWTAARTWQCDQRVSRNRSLAGEFRRASEAPRAAEAGEHPVELARSKHLSSATCVIPTPDRFLSRFSEISFHVRRGETIAFVGPSGSGKTTLVKLLVGLYAPKSGHISLQRRA